MDKLPEAEKLGLRIPATLQAKPLEAVWTELMLLAAPFGANSSAFRLGRTNELVADSC